MPSPSSLNELRQLCLDFKNTLFIRIANNRHHETRKNLIAIVNSDGKSDIYVVKDIDVAIIQTRICYWNVSASECLSFNKKSLIRDRSGKGFFLPLKALPYRDQILHTDFYGVRGHRLTINCAHDTRCNRLPHW